MNGWIKLHRSLNNHWIYNEKRKFSKLEAWIDILMTVNYEDTKVLIKGKLYEVKRGQSILSLDSWAKRWSWDKSSARRFFNLLQKDSMISVISDNITTHLTVCKYDSYQGIENANETQTKRKRNSNEIQTTPIKERKEIEEEKENKEILSFEDFWKIYPIKKSKAEAEKKFKKLTVSEIEKIKIHLPIFVNYKPFETYSHPHASTYLNQKRFNDEIDVIKDENKYYDKELAEKAKRYYNKKGWTKEQIREDLFYDIDTDSFIKDLRV